MPSQEDNVEFDNALAQRITEIVQSKPPPPVAVDEGFEVYNSAPLSDLLFSLVFFFPSSYFFSFFSFLSFLDKYNCMRW